MKLKFFGRIAALLLCAFLFCGCDIFEEAMEEGSISEDPTSDSYEPRFVLRVHNIVRYPRATSLEREVSNGDGTTIWINTNSSFGSKRIREAKVVPRPGDPDMCDLKLKLDKQGKAQWQMLGSGSRGEPMAVVIDGRLVGTFVPEIPEDDDKLTWVVLRIGVDSYTARGVARYANKNYSYFNPKAADWFNWTF